MAVGSSAGEQDEATLETIKAQVLHGTSEGLGLWLGAVPEPTPSPVSPALLPPLQNS